MQGSGQEEERQEGRPAGAKETPFLEPFARRIYKHDWFAKTSSGQSHHRSKNADKKVVLFSQGGTLKRHEFMETLKSFFQFKSVEDLALLQQAVIYDQPLPMISYRCGG